MRVSAIPRGIVSRARQKADGPIIRGETISGNRIIRIGTINEKKRVIDSG